MHRGFSHAFIVIALFLSLLAWGQDSPKNGGDFSSGTAPVSPDTKVPAGVILVKGAWSSASDSVTPVPEAGNVMNAMFRNPYFGLTYALPKGWAEEVKGPPPSDSGRYVLLQLQPGDTFKGTARGSVLITAQDMFFTSLPATNALELVNYEKDTLQSDYKLELPPTQTSISGHPFVFYAYWSPVAELHWYVLATEVRCHEVEIVLTSRDTRLLESLTLAAEHMDLPLGAGPTAGTGGGDAPVCIKDYTTGENVISRIDPIFTEASFNPVPVRIIIDKTGKVQHIHFISALPSQTKAISDALKQWKFKPYLQNHQAVEVETGIMFGRVSHEATSAVE